MVITYNIPFSKLTKENRFSILNFFSKMYQTVKSACEPRKELIGSWCKKTLLKIAWDRKWSATLFSLIWKLQKRYNWRFPSGDCIHFVNLPCQRKKIIVWSKIPIVWKRSKMSTACRKTELLEKSLTFGRTTLKQHHKHVKSSQQTLVLVSQTVIKFRQPVLFCFLLCCF